MIESKLNINYSFKKLLAFVLLLFIGIHSSFSTEKTYRIGAFNYYPAIFKDKDGVIKGFYVEALAEIEKHEGIKFEYIYGSWNEGLDRIKNSEIDLMPSVAFLPERAKFLNYGKEALLTVWGEVYVPLNSELDNILSFSNKSIAIMKGDANAKAFKDLVSKFGIYCRFVEKDDFEMVFDAVAINEVDAGVVNSTFGAAKVREYGLRSTGVVFNPFDIYFATRKGTNKELLKIIDSYFNKWKHEENSVYNVARQKWSHGSIGKVEVFPEWLKYFLFVIAILVVATLGFAVLLKLRINKATQNILKQKELISKSEAKFRNYINNSPDGIFVLDENGHYLEVNPAAARMTGYSPEEIIRMNISELHSKGKIEIARRNFQKMKEDGLAHFELEYVRRDGAIRWWSVDSIKLSEIRYIGFVKDITERKLADDALKESEQYLKETQTIARIGTYTLDIPTGMWECSEMLDNIFGIKVDFDKSIDGWVSIMHPDWQNIMNEYFANEVIGNKLPFNKEYQIVRNNDKAVRWVHGLGALKFDENGMPVKMIGTIRDITERKEVEEALRLRESYLTAIIENQPGLIWLKDREGKFLAVNSKFSKSCDIEKPEMIVGKTDKDIWPKVLAEKYISDDLKVIEQRNSCIIEEPIAEKGKIKWFETFKTSIIDNNGEVIGTTGYSTDITERKEFELLLQNKNNEIEAQNTEYLLLNEELQQTIVELDNAKRKAEESDKLKTAFLQNMSHEIRTPLNAIMGFSALLPKNLKNSDKLAKYAKIIEQRGGDLLEIINDILDIAKIESGQLFLTNGNCQLNILFSELSLFFDEYKFRLNKSDIDFVIDVESEISNTIIYVDAVKLRQILINLITNAFKFTDKGKVELKCFINNERIYFSVEDSGIGISAEQYKMIFERFVQVSHGASRLYGGTGLGLSIVKGLLDIMGGEIKLESELGKGSAFTFYLPLVIAKAQPKNTGKKSNIVKLTLPGKTILIVEDDHYNTEYLMELLSESGATILHSEFGTHAIELAKQHEPSIILMDIRLPDISGYEAIKQILEHNAQQKIIAQTAFATIDDKEKALQIGCVAYISKPLKMNELYSLLQQYLE